LLRCEILCALNHMPQRVPFGWISDKVVRPCLLCCPRNGSNSTTPRAKVPPRPERSKAAAHGSPFSPCRRAAAGAGHAFRRRPSLPRAHSARSPGNLEVSVSAGPSPPSRTRCDSVLKPKAAESVLRHGQSRPGPALPLDHASALLRVASYSLPSAAR
jgi:hypothetical protein